MSVQFNPDSGGGRLSVRFLYKLTYVALFTMSVKEKKTVTQAKETNAREQLKIVQQKYSY